MPGRSSTAALLFALVLGFSSAARAQTAPVIQDDDGVRDAHRALQVSTMVSLLITSSLGTILAINKPTLFGEGRCETGDPIFGDYGCKGLSVLHGISAILSIVAYTATTAVEFAAFDWPGQEEHGTAFDVASGVHLAGMATLPFLGLVSVVPEVLGMDPQEAAMLQRILRTLHLSIGYVTVGTYVATAAIDLD